MLPVLSKKINAQPIKTLIKASWFITFISFVMITNLGWSQEVISTLTASDTFSADRDWNLSYFNFSSSSAEVTQNGVASWNLYQYFAWNYKLSYNQRLSLRMAFNTQTPGPYDNKGNFRSFTTKGSDFHIVYSQYNLAEFPFEWDMNGSFYLYLPTSDSSQEKNWIARTRAWLLFEKKLNRKTLLSINFKPEYFFNTQKSYLRTSYSTSSEGRSTPRYFVNNNQKASIESDISLSYVLNSTFSPQVSLGFNQDWTENSEHIKNATPYRDSGSIELATWITINNQLRFLAGYSTEAILTNRPSQQEIIPFHPSQSQFFILTFWKIL